MRYSIVIFVLISAIEHSTVAHGIENNVSLGPFVFDAEKFGDSLIESDGGTWSGTNWLSTTIESAPGNPQHLTGPDFVTGIANIGSGENRTYTIGYNLPIPNGIGDDFGVVVARFSSSDFKLAVSSDFINYPPDIAISENAAVNTGESRNFFVGLSSGIFTADLFVHPVDLGIFGGSFGCLC